ncbi:MAG: hypothetical protein NWQ38_05670 [Cellulophaga sp.]|nr:hypothetical protein [Cellulophaga sp.]
MDNYYITGKLKLKNNCVDKSYLKVNQEPKMFQHELRSITQSVNEGIYKLYYFEDDKPRTIYRLFSKDDTGVLYIGMTEGPLYDRVCNLQKALVANWETDEGKPASSGHTQMGKKYYRIRKKINIDDLYIQITPDHYPKQAETNAIEDYVKKFVELPPLNGQYGSIDPEWSIFS